MIQTPLPSPDAGARPLHGAAPQAVKLTSHHIAEIDALRAVAVVLVMLHHAHVPGFAGGFLGVDMFFVISGFVITLRVLRDLGGGRYSTLEFFARRIVRLIPALFLTLLGSAVAATFLLMPIQYEDFFRSLIATLLFQANLYFWMDTGYFAAAASLKPLLHTWSLAIEEQFYLLFALGTVLLLAWPRLRLPRHWLLIAALAGAALFVLIQEQKPSVAFYWTPFRAWEIALGVWLALRHHASTPNAGSGSSIPYFLGGTAMVCAVGLGSLPSLHGVAIPLSTFGSAAMIYSAARAPAPLLGRWGWCLLLGLSSYAIYLVHQPILAFLRIWSGEALSPLQTAGALLLAVLLGIGLHRWVESPLRLGYRQLSTDGNKAAATVRLFVVSALLLMAAAYVAIQWNWQRLQWVSNTATATDIALLHQAVEQRRIKPAPCFVIGPQQGRPLSTKGQNCLERTQTLSVVVGDSHANDFVGVLAAHRPDLTLIRFDKGGCRAFSPMDDCLYEDAAHFIEQYAPKIDWVYFVDKGSYYNRAISHGHSREDNIHATRAYLERLHRWAPTVWIGPKAEPHIDLGNISLLGRKTLQDLMQANPSAPDIAAVDRWIRTAMAPSNVPYLSTFEAVNYQHSQDFLINGALTYSDTNHWSAHGERLLGTRLTTAMVGAGLLAAAPQSGLR